MSRSVAVRVEDFEAYYKKQRADSSCGFAEEFEVKPEKYFKIANLSIPLLTPICDKSIHFFIYLHFFILT